MNRTYLLTPLDPKDMRYRTIGDWYDDEYIKSHPHANIVVADLENQDYNFLILVHELVEYYLCQKRGITDEVVTAFDKSVPDADDPGMESGAPYHREHLVATAIETLLAAELGVKWSLYNKRMEEVWEKIPSHKEEQDVR